MNEQKDTIYVDIDDEITAIIDKVTSSHKKIVALVLPKRATVLQSVVNMRLLKRAADEADKSLVLITSDAGVMPLAGATGLYVAKTLQSKPVIPEDATNSSTATESSADGLEDDMDTSKSVGELAGDTDEDTIEIDDLPADKAAVAAAGASKAKPKKPKKNSKLKIPNFDSFRKKLFLGIGVVLLLAVVWYVAFFVMPKAKIIIRTDTTQTTADVTFTADPKAITIDVENNVVPAVVKETKKTTTQKVAATGEKNLGDKAKGSMVVTNCIHDDASHTLPAGTAFSSGDYTFVTNEPVTLEAAIFNSSNVCKSTEFGLSQTVSVTAANGGGSYNLSARNYVSAVSGVTGSGSNMTGGTDKIVKVVSQQDVDGAKQKALEQNNADAAKAELQDQLKKEGYIPLVDTFSSSEPSVSPSPAVGSEANEVTVTVVVTDSMVGAKHDDVKALVENQANKSIDASKQMIMNNGLDSATYQVYDHQADGKTRLNVKSEVTAGPKLNTDDIKKSVAGKRRGEIQEILKQPGIQEVEVIYSPFWVSKAPKDTNKITIVFEQKNGQ